MEQIKKQLKDLGFEENHNLWFSKNYLGRDIDFNLYYFQDKYLADVWVEHLRIKVQVNLEWITEFDKLFTSKINTD